MASPQYQGPWERVRRLVTERDEFRCQLRLPGCTTVATERDHIVAIADGGAWLDEANLGVVQGLQLEPWWHAGCGEAVPVHGAESVEGVVTMGPKHSRPIWRGRP